MAAQCYIMDITNAKSRTARLCWLEATIGLAIMISKHILRYMQKYRTTSGSPLGATIKNMFGFTALYSIILGLTVLALIGCCILRESIERVSEEKKQAMIEEKEAVEIKCDKGALYKSIKKIWILFYFF